MPVLRFVRDKKGFENIYVVHTAREAGRARSRLLYWFRTPPGVKVGRSALDEVAIRRLEEQHPELEFDWPRMLKLRDSLAAASQTSARRPVDRRRRTSERGERASGRGAGAATAARGAAAPSRTSRGRPAPPPVVEAPDDLPEIADSATEGAAEDIFSEAARDVADVIAEESAPRDLDEAAVTDAAEETESPSRTGSELARLIGDEGVERVRASYAEVLARISRKESDPARQQALREAVEPLDPDLWMDGPDAAAGLQRFEQEIRRLRARLGRRRGGRRRSGRRRVAASEDRAQEGSNGAPAASSAETGPVPDSTDEV